MAYFDLTDELTAEAVAEVSEETAREAGHEGRAYVYRDNAWWGNINARGVFTRSKQAAPEVQSTLDNRVVTRILDKRRAREEEARAEAAAQVAEAQAFARQQQEYATALGGGGRRPAGDGGAAGPEVGADGRIMPPRYPAGHPRAGQFRPWSEAGMDAGGAGAGEEGGGGGGLGGLLHPRSPQSPYSVPRYVANLFSSVLGAGAGMATMGMGMALSPLGGTGAGATQVGQAVVSLLVGGLNAVASAGSAVLSLAIGGLLAGAVGGAAAMVLAAVGDLFGQIAQAITSSVQGVVTVIKDVFNDAGQYARAAMNMNYFGGYGVGDASGAISTFGAFGMSPETTSGLFGQWSMRPEFLSMRLGPLGGLRMDEGGGIDWAGTLRGMRGALGSYPQMAQYQVLQALLGGQGAQALMPIMQMGEGAFEQALGNAEGLQAPTDQLRALREELAPLQAQVGLTAQLLKVELAGAALQPVVALLQTLLELTRENRGALREWLSDLPGRLAGWISEATEWAEKLADALPRVAESLADIARRVQDIYGHARALGEFITAHPTLSALFAGAAVGGSVGGFPGAVMGGLTVAGMEVGGSLYGGGGVVGGGLGGLALGGLLLSGGAAGTRAAIGRMLMGPATLAFGAGSGGGLGSLLTAGGGLAGGGSLLAGTGGIVALVGGILAASTAIAAWTSGFWGSYKEQKEAEKAAAAMEGGARELGYITPELAAESFGPEIARRFREGDLSQREQGMVADRMRQMMAERRARLQREEGEGEEGGFGGAMRAIRERMAQIADNTSPERVREANRQAQEDARDRNLGTLTIRLDPEFERMFILELTQSAFRDLQVSIGG